jgi:prevent-host-death family protein
MKTAGIREARQNLTALIEEVRQGRQVVITDRGRPVARLVPPVERHRRPFPDLAAFRRRRRRVTPPVSRAVIEERDEGY